MIAVKVTVSPTTTGSGVISTPRMSVTYIGGSSGPESGNDESQPAKITKARPRLTVNLFIGINVFSFMNDVP